MSPHTRNGCLQSVQPVCPYDGRHPDPIDTTLVSPILRDRAPGKSSSMDANALACDLGLDGGDVDLAEVAVRAEGDGGGDAGTLTDHGAAGHVARGGVGYAVAADAAAGH